MKVFSFIKRVFKSYKKQHVFFTVFAVFLIALMHLKMIYFPAGFGWTGGEANIYTEALVSTTGFQNLNPLFVDYNEADREVSGLIFSGLMKYDPSKRTVVDDLATLSVNDDITEYTLTIKDGIKWHDGHDFDVDDVIFTYSLISDPSFKNEILKANFASVEIQKIDDKSVKFVLEKANAFFVSNLVIGILPEHLLSDVSADQLLADDFNKMPVGTGPYEIKEAFEVFPDGRMQINLERFDDYYSLKPDIEVLRMIAYPDFSLLLNDLNSINAISKVTGDYIDEFQNYQRFKEVSYELPQYTAVFMNMESRFLKEQKVRVAIQKSVDKDALMDLFPDKKPVDTPLMELDQENWEYQYSKEDAEGALKDAGYFYEEEDTEKSGFRFNEDGEALELKLIVRLYSDGSKLYNETKDLVAFLQKSWEDVGFDIKVEFLFKEDFEQKILTRDYDLLLVGQSLGYNLDTYSYWHSTQANPQGQNFSNYKSFAVDTLIEDIRSIFDLDKRQEKLSGLADQIREDFPALFLYRPVYYYVFDEKIYGISMDAIVFPSDRHFNIAEWAFTEDKEEQI